MSGHHHHHGHHHHVDLHSMDSLNRAFLIGIALNVVFVIVEAVAGFTMGSLALLTDAGHNLSDVGSLLISRMAFRLARLSPNEKYSYGLGKSTVLASLSNAILLLIAVGGIGFEAVRRLNNPVEIPGLQVAVVAGIGVVINTATAWLFHKDQETDLNVKGAYLHMAADAAVSVGVLLSGVLLHYTGWTIIDPIISFIILTVILVGTWSLLRKSILLSLDGVPPGIDLEEIRQKAKALPGVKDIHHLHVWPISTTRNALTAHLVFYEAMDKDEWFAVKSAFKHDLLHMNIHHVTLETACETEDSSDLDCR